MVQQGQMLCKTTFLLCYYSKAAFTFITLTLYKWAGGPGVWGWAQAHGTLLPCYKQMNSHAKCVAFRVWYSLWMHWNLQLLFQKPCCQLSLNNFFSFLLLFLHSFEWPVFHKCNSSVYVEIKWGQISNDCGSSCFQATMLRILYVCM